MRSSGFLPRKERRAGAWELGGMKYDQRQRNESGKERERIKESLEIAWSMIKDARAVVLPIKVIGKGSLE